MSRRSRIAFASVESARCLRCLLRWGSLFCRRLLSVALVEAVDSTSRVNEFLFASEKRVASRTDFNVQVTFASGAGFKSLAAGAADRNFNVFWVDSWFHYFFSRHSL